MKRKSRDLIDESQLVKKMSKQMPNTTNKFNFKPSKNIKKEESKTLSKLDNTSEVHKQRTNFELSLVNKNFDKRHYSPITKAKAKENFDDLIFPLTIKTTLGGKANLQNSTELVIYEKDYKADDCIDLIHDNKAVGYDFNNIDIFQKKFLSIY
jgi:hypothetical protein